MAKKDLTVYRGVTYNMSYTHIESMAGGIVYFTVKPAKYDTDATDATGMPKKTISSFTVGNTRADWTLSDSDMYIPPGTYYYDILVEDSSSHSLPPIFEGKFIVLPHPTNRNTQNG